MIRNGIVGHLAVHVCVYIPLLMVVGMCQVGCVGHKTTFCLVFRQDLFVEFLCMVNYLTQEFLGSLLSLPVIWLQEHWDYRSTLPCPGDPNSCHHSWHSKCLLNHLSSPNLVCLFVLDDSYSDE